MNIEEELIHIVRVGECMTSIAAEKGFAWQTLWNHPANAKLKSVRGNPHLLLEGDEVAIPCKQYKEHTAATDTTHRFVRKNVRSRLRFRLLAQGAPRAFLSYTLSVDGELSSGVTDEDGFVDLYISPQAQRGCLTVMGGQISESYTLLLGHLDPINEVRGVQQRLSNLWCNCELTGELDEQTLQAISTFISKYDYAGDAKLDDRMRRSLQEIHGA